LNRHDAFAQWKGSFDPVARLVGRMMLPHHGAQRNFNKELISYASAATPFITVDCKDYSAFKRPPRKVRTAIGGRLIAVTEDRLLTEVSGQPDGSSRVDDVMKW
jgi:hypothetical protein